MELSGDDLAGVVDSFGALTRGELRDALAELAFKQGEDADSGTFEDLIDEAIDGYQLISLDTTESGRDPLLVVGPSAFPTRPEGTQDLRHILDIGEREIDRERAGEAAMERLREEAALAIEMGNTAEIERLIDVSYDIEAWAPVTLDEIRSHLDESR
ncbi:DUF7109 family protein [Halovenus sp. HT40]|uniref:DUF7109 family protein n=1 Tax=Halovenus sp. HT40 TaxID=3126691 RepID=UPI00300EB1F8